MCLTGHLNDDKVRPAIEALRDAHATFTALADQADRQARDGFPDAKANADEMRRKADQMDLAAGRLVE